MEVARTSLIMRRAFAYLVDLFLMFLVVVMSILLFRLSSAENVLGIIYLFFYPVCEWYFGGRTPGKYLTGLIVINGAGCPPSLMQTLIRGFMRNIEACVWVVTVFVFAYSARCQRVGDMLARTYVMPVNDFKALQDEAGISSRSKRGRLF